jgi:hypothetical protein
VGVAVGTGVAVGVGAGAGESATKKLKRALGAPNPPTIRVATLKPADCPLP